MNMRIWQLNMRYLRAQIWRSLSHYAPYAPLPKKLRAQVYKALMICQLPSALLKDNAGAEKAKRLRKPAGIYC